MLSIKFFSLSDKIVFIKRIFNIYLNFCNVFKIQHTLWLSATTGGHDLYKLDITLPDVASTNVVNFAIKKFETSKTSNALCGLLQQLGIMI